MFNFSFLLKSAAKKLSFMFAQNCGFFLIKSIGNGYIIYLFYFFKLFIKLKFLFLFKKKEIQSVINSGILQTISF